MPATTINLHHSHQLHVDEDGVWMFQGSDCLWYPFINDDHFINTRDEGYRIAYFKRTVDLPKQFPA